MWKTLQESSDAIAEWDHRECWVGRVWLLLGLSPGILVDVSLSVSQQLDNYIGSDSALWKKKY